MSGNFGKHLVERKGKESNSPKQWWTPFIIRIFHLLGLLKTAQSLRAEVRVRVRIRVRTEARVRAAARRVT